MFIQALRGLLLACSFMILGVTSQAAEYAALVMDARTGQVLHSENADTRLHPASLTKMMTLYLVFTEIKAGRMTADQPITISRYAASKPPSKLGLRAGQTIQLRYLIRAAAVKSANDAAAAIAEAVSGSEAAFARRMTEVGRAMGMTRTNFRNASGLTESGHMSTARDMALLGRQLFYDFPEYYNLFSRRSTDAKVKTVYNTNRRLLNAYPGADGIKTGYTRAAGYNLVSSARRGQERVIVSVFGGQSTAWRNERVADLMDLGFRKMPSVAQVNRPRRLVIGAPSTTVAAVTVQGSPPRRSARPMARTLGQGDPREAELLAQAVNQAVSAVSTKTVDQITPEIEAALAEIEVDRSPAGFAIISPRARPSNLPVAKTIRVTRTEPEEAPAADEGHYMVELGGTHSRNEAERLLLKTALQELEALEGSHRRLLPATAPGRYRAQFVGLSEQEAQTACARLAARQTACEVVAAGG